MNTQRLNLSVLEAQETLREITDKKVIELQALQDIIEQKKKTDSDALAITDLANKILIDANQRLESTMKVQALISEKEISIKEKEIEIESTKTEINRQYEEFKEWKEESINAVNRELEILEENKEDLEERIDYLEGEEEELSARVRDQYALSRKLESDILALVDAAKSKELLRDKKIETIEKETRTKEKEIDKVKENLNKAKASTESIREELRLKEQDLLEREENLLILSHRLQTQIREYFPNITIKV